MIILGPRESKAVPARYGEEVQVYWDAAKSWWVIHGQDELLGYSYGPLYLKDVRFEVDQEMFDLQRKGMPTEWPVFYVTGTWVDRLTLTADHLWVEADKHDGWVQEDHGWMQKIRTAHTARLTDGKLDLDNRPGIWARRKDAND